MGFEHVFDMVWSWSTYVCPCYRITVNTQQRRIPSGASDNPSSPASGHCCRESSGPQWLSADVSGCNIYWELSQRQSLDNQTQKSSALYLVPMTGAGHYAKQEYLAFRQMVSTNFLQCNLPLLSCSEHGDISSIYTACSFFWNTFFIAMLQIDMVPTRVWNECAERDNLAITYFHLSP